MLEHLTRQGVTGRLELVLVDRGVTGPQPAVSAVTTTLRSVESGVTTSRRSSAPSGTPGAVEVAYCRLGRSRRLAKSFENTTSSAIGWLQVACITTTLRHLSRERARGAPVALAA